MKMLLPGSHEDNLQKVLVLRNIFLMYRPGGVPPVSDNALDRIIYAIFLPLFQVIQRCSSRLKVHIMGDPAL